ncbi:hypothetical protein BC834DRAFT_461228 [Gloeopeniophorella convolvens]|nr:hypothetical protein BC834DRAFT_461228 [Gloeopeniophorella convolvens]
MSSHSPRYVPSGNQTTGLPARPGRVFLGGAAIIGGTFAAVWYYLNTKHARKASREPGEPGSLPSWEHRILQAVDPVRGEGSGTPDARVTRRAGDIDSRALPLGVPTREPDRAQHRTLASGGAPLYAENGAMMHPVPQRDRGDGFAYTKKQPPLGANGTRVDGARKM